MSKKIILLSSILFLMTALPAFAQLDKNVLLLEDFEGAITTGPGGTINAGGGGGSSATVAADNVIFKNGAQSLKVTYNAVSGGYIWVIALSYSFDLKTAGKCLLEPGKIDWSKYGAISFYLYGSASGAKIAFDIKDIDGEMLRFMVTDDTKGWKLVICPFDQFVSRKDWQPSGATVNGKLDFPIKSFQFEPIAISKGEINIDSLGLEALN